jgi:hypothetical protein
MNVYTSQKSFATTAIASLDSYDRFQVALYASLCRVLEQAPIENKLRVFRLMADTAAGEISERRQQYIDDLWWVAGQVGLVSLLGPTDVQNTLASAFDGGSL